MAELTMTAKELKNRTGDAFRAISRGDTVILTRRGRPVAIMRPASEERHRNEIPDYEEAWAEIESALAATSPEFATLEEAMARTRGRS